MLPENKSLQKSDEDSPLKEIITSSLASKLEAINRYEEVLWKVRAGYLSILYASLTFLVGTAGLGKLDDLPNNITASLTVLFLIMGFSLSAFSVDFAYLRKKMRVIVIRDRLVEVAYNPKCKASRRQIYSLLQVAAERPLKDKFPDLEEKYKSKVYFNFRWILLPIYSVTPVLAIALNLLYRLGSCGITKFWKCT